MSPLISVIIPTYKRPDLLTRALNSLTIETSTCIDIIVVDDDPYASGAEVAKQFNTVRYFAKRGIDKGLSASRNIGIQLSVAPYILFLDDDDFIENGAIDQCASVIRSGHSFYYFNFSYLFPSKKVLVSTADANNEGLLVVNKIPVGAYIIEKSSIRATFDLSMKSHEDWNFLLDNVKWERAMHIPTSLAVIDKTRQDESSMQVRRKDSFWMEFLGIYAKHPSPELKHARLAQLQTLGVTIPEMIFS